MAQSEHIAVFWAREFGSDPSVSENPKERFDVKRLVSECERFYTCYVKDLKFVNKGDSLTNHYKILVYIFGGNEGTAFGGGVEDKVGILWTPASRISKAPYGALAHELGHSFQYLLHAGGAWAFTSSSEGSRGQSIFEMTSQYLLWQAYPEWMTFENYHLEAFLKQTHLSFLHEDNQYHSPYVLEYWAEKHGKDFIGKLWREAKKGEDPVMAYQRITSAEQKAFNDEMFDAARRFITWDLKRIKDIAAKYANQHHSFLDSVGDGWFRISAVNCPQNYGYNGIRLKVPEGRSTIKLEFRGLTGVAGYRAVYPEREGWRYGFVAVTEDGGRVYSDIFSKTRGSVSFKIPEKTSFLWLVVSGAPSQHWEHLTDGRVDNDEQWPYEIKLSGTTLVH